MKMFLKKSGFSLVEMIVYVALFALILLSVINIVLSFSRSYQQLASMRMAEHTGVIAMERLARDIHEASSVDTVNSVLGTSFGTLVVANGATSTRFYVSSGELRVSVNGSDIGPLSVSSGKLTSLVFRHIISPVNQAVKIDMTVQGVTGQASTTKTFHSTVILKNS